jgi:hypothetical protein
MARAHGQACGIRAHLARFAILAASLAFLVVIGGALSRERRGTADFFLVRRRIP